MASRILTTTIVLALAAGFLAAAPMGALADAPQKGLVVSASNPDPTTTTGVMRTDASTGATGQFIAGRGSTFQSPIMGNVIPAFNANTGNHAAYWGCGSGCGKTGLLQFATSISPAPTCSDASRYKGDCGALAQVNTLNALWAGSDAPLSASEKTHIPTGAEVLYIPIAVGAVAVDFNVPGCTDGQITLTAAQIAAIYRPTDSGVNNWGQLAAGNPCLTGVNLPIVPVIRSDNSGTSFAFIDFLCHAVGAPFCPASQTASAFTQGAVGQSGNPAVAAYVATHVGAVGYNEIDVARANNLAMVKIVNRDGNPVAANEANAAAALAALAPTLPESQADWSTVSIVWAPGPSSYPITSFTYVMTYGNPAQIPGFAATWTADQYAQSAALFRFIVSDAGQALLPSGYVHLTSSVQALANRGIDRMNYGPEQAFTIGGPTTVGSTSTLDQGYPTAGISITLANGVFTPSAYAYQPATGATQLANGEGQFVKYDGTVVVAGGVVFHDGQQIGRVATVASIPNGVYSHVEGQVANHHLLVRSAA